LAIPDCRLPIDGLLIDDWPLALVPGPLRDEDIYVIAVAHTSRRPGYWQHR